MNILGISGLDRALAFKKTHWPALDEREYRMRQGQDSAAALIVDGKIVAAAAEERFSGEKHTGAFPVAAISYCLKQAGLTIEEIDILAHAFDYSSYERLYRLDPTTSKQYDEVLSRASLVETVGNCFPSFPGARISQVDHHLAHAASAYFTSGWDESLVVVIDAMGEANSVSVYWGNDGELKKIHEIAAIDSIGILYSVVTLHLGFDFNADEYKIMGLAPYGDPARFRPFFDSEVLLQRDGSISIPSLGLNRTRDEREVFAATRRYIDKRLTKRRDPMEDIEQEHRDVAAALQQCLNAVVLHICGHFRKVTGLKRIALAGGVALNCAANGRLLRSQLFDDVYVQPASGDDGAALGAALYCGSVKNQVKNSRFSVPFLGPSYSREEVERALALFNGRIRVQRFSDFSETCAAAAHLFAEGKILAWYRGRMEFGPRALGNRSILADPGDPDMRDRINAIVKKREAFRPFAPAVSIEQVHEWFDVGVGTSLPYMIATVEVHKRHRLTLPAITHEDGSARVQTVSAVDNPDFHALLKAVGARSGREMVLNTSFNVKGQPIVNSPEEALQTFLGTELDGLFLEDALVTRWETLR